MSASVPPGSPPPQPPPHRRFQLRGGTLQTRPFRTKDRRRLVPLRRPAPSLADPEIERLLHRYTAEQAIEQRKVTETEIRQRTIYTIVNEGARLLEEGIALRAVDIDIVYVNGYGFPTWRGGPCRYAESVGLSKVLDCRPVVLRRPGPLLEARSSPGPGRRQGEVGLVPSPPSTT